jgi:hypothetical protein
MIQRSSRSEACRRGHVRTAKAPVVKRARTPRALLLALVLAGCAPGAATSFPSASELPGERRRPDGVAIDPASLPSSSARAEAHDGVVALQTPLGISLAVDAVAEFFRRVVAEDSDGLSELWTRDALALQTGPGGQGQSPSAGLWWEQRFRRLEYGKLAGEPIYREAELEIYRAEDVPDAPRHPAIPTDTLNDSDVIIRVPIVTARIAAERLLGDEVVLWLRRDGARFKIYRLLEDFQLQ